MKKYWLIVLSILWLLLPSFAQADEQSLGEVQVQTGSEEDSGGLPEAYYDSIVSYSVITADELKGRRTSLSEALQDLSGVQIRQRGGLDDFATVSIRGSTSEQVVVYVDGIPLNQALGGAVNISTIPTDQIERVEVYKGAAPIRFSTSSIGGVINIVTKKAKQPGRTTSIPQSYGSFNTYEGSLLQSERFEHTAYNFGYTYTRSAGDFTFKDDNGTPFNPNDDQIEKRQNNQFARHNFLTGFEWLSKASEGFSENLSLLFQNQFFREDRGIPGLGNLTSDTAHLSTTRNGFSIVAKRPNLWRELTLSLVPFFQYQKQQFTDLDGDIGLGAQDNDDDTYQYGATALAQVPIGRHQRWSATLDYRGEQFLPEDFTQSPPAGPHSLRNTASVGLEDEIYLADEKVVLNPSVRTEHIFDDQGEAPLNTLHPVSGKVGIKYQPWGSQGVATFKTNFSRGFRLPSFSELFGDRGTFVGNPDLQPEKSLNWDIGALITHKPIHFEVTYFLNHVDDLIQLLQTSQFTVQAQNLTKARIQGVETSFSGQWLKHVAFDANYTFQSAVDISGLPGLDGNELPGRPEHEASGRLTLYNSWGRLFSDLTFQDGNFLDSQDILRVDHRLLMGAGFSINLPKVLIWGFEGKNLLNDRVSDIVGFPLPGRSFYGKLELKI